MAIFCGVDLIEVDRIRNSLENLGESFRDKVFTEREIEYCESRKGSRHLSYAARFAAKEAVSKAFGTGISEGMGWKDIEVLNDEMGKPYVILKGIAREVYDRLNGRGISLSISHCAQFAVAYAVIEA